MLYLITSLALGLLAKWGYAHAEVHQLVWVLRPTSFLVQLFLGEPYQYAPELGFVFPQVGMVINRACAGVNFMIVLATASMATIPPRVGRKSHRWLAFLVMPILAYVVTLGANASRILCLVRVGPWQQSLGPATADIMHTGIGALVYVGFLLAAYTLFTRISQSFSAQSV